MNTVMDVKGLRFGFGPWRKRVLDGVDLPLEDGAVTVLLGQNGSGKSTLLKVLLGVLRPEAGAVRLFGQDPLRAHRAVLQRIGYVPDVPDAPAWMKPKDLFRFLAPQYPTWDHARCGELCERLAVPVGTKFKHLSRGQGMKAMLAAALAPSPELLLLDEPFAGLDPLVREEVLAGVVDALGAGDDAGGGARTVLCATHELDVAARIADRVAVLQDGRIVRHGTLAQVLGQQDPVAIPYGLQRMLRDAAATVVTARTATAAEVLA